MDNKLPEILIVFICNAISNKLFPGQHPITSMPEHLEYDFRMYLDKDEKIAFIRALREWGNFLVTHNAHPIIVKEDYPEYIKQAIQHANTEKSVRMTLKDGLDIQKVVWSYL